MIDYIPMLFLSMGFSLSFVFSIISGTDFKRNNKLSFYLMMVLFAFLSFFNLFFLILKLVQNVEIPVSFLSVNSPLPIYYQIFDSFYVVLLFYFILAPKYIGTGHSRKLLKKVTAQIFILSIVLIFLTLGVVFRPDLFILTDQRIMTAFTPINIASIPFVVWKIILLANSHIAVCSGGRINNPEFIIIYKKRNWIYLLILAEIVLNVMFFFFPMAAVFMLRTPSFLILMYLSYDCHRNYVKEMDARVKALSGEKDMLSDLLKEVNTLINTGEMDLEAVSKTMVEESVSATKARGGAALIKDPVTGRLNVIYVQGIYPPTKNFTPENGEKTDGETLTERFRNEMVSSKKGLFGKVVQTGETIFIPDTSLSGEYVQMAPDDFLVTSFIAVPLKLQEKVIGLLTVVHDRKHFTFHDRMLLENFSEQGSISLKQIKVYQEIMEKKEAEKEIEMASEIQQSMLPRDFPESEKYELYGFSIPVKGVGGDLFDFIDFGSDKVALSIFDVAGKGIPASLIMVMIRSIFRTIVNVLHDTRDVMKKLNNTIAGEILNGQYATGFYMLYNADKNSLNYTNAGHPPAVLFRREENRFDLLDSFGLPIGVITNMEYEQRKIEISNGDIVVLYTDGITEAMNHEGDMFDMERLKDIIYCNRNFSAREIACNIRDTVMRFTGDFPQHDDETILVLKVK